jgi:hypothetical protein
MMVLAAGLALALLKQATPPLAVATLVVAILGLVAVTVLAAWPRRRRPFTIGAALFGHLFLAFAVFVPLIGPAGFDGPVSALADRLAAYLHPEREGSHRLPRDRFDESFSEWSEKHPESESFQLDLPENDPSQVRIRWVVSNREPFRRTLVSLLGLLVALAGGLAAEAWTRDRSRCRPPSPT